jgi:tetratricopeptide (TPR) repeat protein
MAEDIERLRQAALKDPAQLVRLADALVANDRSEEAVQACRRGLSARPDDIPLRLALGRALSAAGQLEEAQAALLDAVSRQQRAKAESGRLPPVAPPGRRQSLEATARSLPSFDPVENDEPATSAQGRLQELRGRGAQPQSSRRVEDPTPLPPRIEEQRMPSRRRDERGDERSTGRAAHEEYLPPREEYVPSSPERERLPRATGSRRAPDSSGQAVDLEAVAETLFGSSSDEGDAARWQAEIDSHVAPDQMAHAWDARRARTFVWLWVSLVLISGGIVGGWIWREKEKAKMLEAAVARADVRSLEASDEADLDARNGYANALRAEPRLRKYFAMVALADARLAADQGEDSDSAGWAMLKRAEREGKRHTEPDLRADREQRQARALLAFVRGESCTEVNPAEDGDVAARCALQKGDVDGARKILAQTVSATGEAHSLRALLTLGSLELGVGDLDAAQSAYAKVLTLYPHHPRALVGRALIALERNESPPIEIPPGRLGPTTEGWFHLAAGLSAMGRGAPEAQVRFELDSARKGIIHDGRLALLYGRARLMQGQVGEAEEAMRVAERLDPNDSDVAVLDAEVALAKGFEDKVSAALAARPPTPRSLAVLGRAQCLTGRYREAAATLDAALARRPGDAVAVTYRAIARAHLGDSAGAIRELERAAATLSSTAPHYGLGLLAYERHDLLRSRGELSKALEHNSESFRARALLGRVLRDLGKPKEALAELDEVVRQAPALMSAHAARARLYLDLGRVREARTDARSVIDSGRANADDKLVYAEATIRLGRADDGERALKEAVDAGIPQPRVAHLRLVLQSWRGPKEALVAAKAMEKDRHGPAAGDAQLALDAADAWRRGGDLRNAQADDRAALFGDPLHANLGLGRIALGGGQRDEAEQSYRAALAAWDKGSFALDDQTEARIGLGRTILLRDPKSKEAAATFEAAVKDDGNDAEAHFWLARAYSDVGDGARARLQADKAVELDDSYAEAFALDGDLWRGTSRDKAKKAYKRYLELSPNGEQAKAVKHSLAQLR